MKRAVLFQAIFTLVLTMCISCKNKENFDSVSESYFIGMWKIEEYNNQDNTKIEFQEDHKVFIYFPLNGYGFDKIEGGWALNSIRKTIKFSFDIEEYEIIKINKNSFSVKNNNSSLSFIKI